MQNMPIIIAIFLAAILIIAVFLWRVKPHSVDNSDLLNKRISEDESRIQALQTKLEDNEISLRNAESHAAAANATLESILEHANIAERKLDSAASDYQSLQARFNEVQPVAVKAQAEKDAAEAARGDLADRCATLAAKNNDLQVHLHQALERAAGAEKDAANTRAGLADSTTAHKAKTQELESTRNQLSIALARQQSDDAAANRFENIGKAVLTQTLEQAKRSVGELTETFQKSSGLELEKHAVAITQTLEPLQAQLTAYGIAVESLKKGTQENYGSLKQQLEELQKTERSLHEQAKALTTALSASPKVKGSYGELILKQLVEFVGMQDKCHFETQALRDTEEGRKIPDLVVSLPGGQKVIVDAKAVMDACVEAQIAQDDVQRAILVRKHCDNVRSRVTDLASKDYYADHKDSVEAVVLFLPAENLYATAMENDPGLTEFAMIKNVIICGPNSLMLLLKVSNQLWRRASVEKEVRDIRDCGEKIYKAACDFVDKFASVGRKIQSLELEYNGAVGTFEGRLLPAGKRMFAFESVSGRKEIGDLEPVKDNVREFKAATTQLAPTAQIISGVAISDSASETALIAGESA